MAKSYNNSYLDSVKKVKNELPNIRHIETCASCIYKTGVPGVGIATFCTYPHKFRSIILTKKIYPNFPTIYPHLARTDFKCDNYLANQTTHKRAIKILNKLKQEITKYTSVFLDFHANSHLRQYAHLLRKVKDTTTKTKTTDSRIGKIE